MARAKPVEKGSQAVESPSRRSKRVSKIDELKKEVKELVEVEKEEMEDMGVEIKASNNETNSNTKHNMIYEDDDVNDSEEKTKSKSKVKSKGTPNKRTNVESEKPTKNEVISEPPTKKARKAKTDIFPPADLDPSIHPKRKGYPVFELDASDEGLNGSISSAEERGFNRPMLIGAHTSAAGGPATALLKAGLLGANGLALFVKSQRKWVSKGFEVEQIQRFKDLLKSKEEGGLGYTPDTVLVHGSYLINLGNPDPAKWKVSYDCFKDDIERCHQLGLKLYNWHPGSTVGACTKEESYKTIAKAINQVHKEVPEVVCVIENMANAKSNVIGTTFSDLKGIINLVEDKSRVRVCLDTCHLFAAGYDIRTRETFEQTMKDFEKVVGWKYLAGVHLNDSKAAFGSGKDLHENIGLGQIGLNAFRLLLRDPHFTNIPIILETPMPDGNASKSKGITSGELVLCDKEIELLYKIQAMDDEEFSVKEKELTEDWRKLRDELEPPKEKKTGGKGKGKKGKKGDEDECDSCNEGEDD